jgi:hypothetical protein
MQNLRPAFEVEGEGAVPIDMTTTIVLVMFSSARSSCSSAVPM